MQFWIHSSSVVFEGTSGHRKSTELFPTQILWWTERQFISVFTEIELDGLIIFVIVGSRGIFVTWSDKQTRVLLH